MALTDGIPTVLPPRLTPPEFPNISEEDAAEVNEGSSLDGVSEKESSSEHTTVSLVKPSQSTKPAWKTSNIPTLAAEPQDSNEWPSPEKAVELKQTKSILPPSSTW